GLAHPGRTGGNDHARIQRRRSADPGRRAGLRGNRHLTVGTHHHGQRGARARRGIERDRGNRDRAERKHTDTQPQQRRERTGGRRGHKYRRRRHSQQQALDRLTERRQSGRSHHRAAPRHRPGHTDTHTYPHGNRHHHPPSHTHPHHHPTSHTHHHNTHHHHRNTHTHPHHHADAYADAHGDGDGVLSAGGWELWSVYLFPDHEFQRLQHLCGQSDVGLWRARVVRSRDPHRLSPGPVVGDEHPEGR